MENKKQAVIFSSLKDGEKFVNISEELDDPRLHLTKISGVSVHQLNDENEVVKTLFPNARSSTGNTMYQIPGYIQVYKFQS